MMAFDLPHLAKSFAENRLEARQSAAREVPEAARRGVVRAEPLSTGLFDPMATDRVFSVPTIIQVTPQPPARPRPTPTMAQRQIPSYRQPFPRKRAQPAYQQRYKKVLPTTSQGGRDNSWADALLRFKGTSVEWQLCPKVFQSLTLRYGTPQVNLFASYSTAQLPLFLTYDRRTPAGHNVPGTHRKVALHDESFDGTQQNCLVQICQVMMWNV
ncbi:hypothetical protein E2C01_061353 [Portunus trituberculatus]|uniref:Uncharacterized protein n=1 Tax=Portunus trituberculatus TaxID=210409 RepID=A0A5B7HC74_PORTR|nr:hypothetical protein [Portunus trituberculatus]